MKKIIIFVVLVVVLGIGYFFLSNKIQNNQLAKEADEKFNEYLRSNYLDLEYTKSDVEFGKGNSWFVTLDVANTKDGDFHLYYNGDTITSDYESAVVLRGNSASRIQTFLNDLDFNKEFQEIIGDNFSTTLLGVNSNSWLSNLPELDMPVEAMISNYLFDCTLIVKDETQIDESMMNSIHNFFSEHGFQSVNVNVQPV